MALGTLLSGFRIRLFDEQGLPLIGGRIAFYDSSTSDPKAVYSSKDLTTPLGTTVTVDSQGYLPPIWLESGLYKAVVQRYLGPLPTDWQTLWDINDLGTITATGAGSTLSIFPNLPALRASAAGTNDSAIALGYYDTGDCGEVLTFYWDPASTRDDDGGAFIRLNDTGAGNPGRFLQIFGPELDIRKWGGIPNSDTIDCIGPYTNMVAYAIDPQVFPEAPPTIAFKASGYYRVSGSVNLDAEWFNNASDVPTKLVNYRMAPGVWFKATVSATLTLTNPIVVEGDTRLCEYPMGLTIVPGSVPFVRPQWLPNFNGSIASKIANADYGIPVKVFGPVDDATIDTPVTWGADIEINSDAMFTVTTGGSLSVTGAFSNLGNAHIFTKTGTGAISFGDKTDINARWFGFGTVSDSTSYLQAAVSAVDPSRHIVIDAPDSPTYGVRGTVSGARALGTELVTFQFNSPIYIGASGYLTDFSIANPTSTSKFTIDGGAVGRIFNESIDPFWFGVAQGTFPASIADNQAKLENCLYAALRSGTPVDGHGKAVAISGQVTIHPTSLSTINQLVIKNLTIQASNWGTGNYLLYFEEDAVTASHIGELSIDNCNLDTNGVSLHSLYCYSEVLTISNTALNGNCVLAGEKLTVNGVTAAGADTSNGFRIFSATLGGSVTGSTFLDGIVSLRGQTAAAAGRSNAMLENISFLGNTLINTTGNVLDGCLRLTSKASNTVVNGVLVTGNTFAGNIESATDSDRIRILDGNESGGSWYNGTSIKHTMIIKDNSYGWSKTTGKQQFLPETYGKFGFSVPVTSVPDVGAGWRYGLVSINPNALEVFMLNGTSNSNASLKTAIIDNSKDSTTIYYNPVIASCAIASLTAQTGNANNASILAPTPYFGWAATVSLNGTCFFKFYEV